MTNSKIVKSIILFAFSISAMVSCIDTNYYVGSKIIPSDQDISIKTVEFDLPVEMKMADSLQSSTFSLLVGSIATETFGRFDVGSAAAMIPVDDTIKWGDNPVFKKMSLEITVSDKTTMSDDQQFIPQNIRIYPLTKELDSTYLYSNSLTDEDIDRTDLLCETVYTGRDTIYFSLPEHWGKKLFSVTQDEIDSTLLFVKKYFGIYFECEPVDEGSVGGRINHLDLSTAKAVLEYTSTNENGIRRDTTTSFAFGSYRVNNLMTSESGVYENASTEETIYVEGLSGIKPYINGVKLYRMIKDWADKEDIDLSHLIVARAVLEFPFEPDEDYSNLETFPKYLYPCTRFTGSSFSAYYPVSGTTNSNTDNGKMNRSMMSYNPDAGPYFQTLVASKEEDIDYSYDIWMMPLYEYVQKSDSSSDDYYNSYGYGYGYPYGYGYGYDPYGYGYGGYGYGGYGYGGYGYSPYGYGYGYSPYGYGGYGYGGYGYGYNNYYSNYYNYYGGMSSSSSSSTTTLYLNNDEYSYGALNGTKDERHPKLILTFSVLK